MSGVRRGFELAGKRVEQGGAKWAGLHQPHAEAEMGKCNGYLNNEHGEDRSRQPH